MKTLIHSCYYKQNPPLTCLIDNNIKMSLQGYMSWGFLRNKSRVYRAMLAAGFYVF